MPPYYLLGKAGSRPWLIAKRGETNIQDGVSVCEREREKGSESKMEERGKITDHVLLKFLLAGAPAAAFRVRYAATTAVVVLAPRNVLRLRPPSLSAVQAPTS